MGMPYGYLATNEKRNMKYTLYSYTFFIDESPQWKNREGYFSASLQVFIFQADIHSRFASRDRVAVAGLFVILIPASIRVSFPMGITSNKANDILS
jgi:hypothetical protein